MDFYERLKSLSPNKYQQIRNATARFGDPDEIFAYINEMPICCPEGEGFVYSDHEVRIDDRFMVLCYKKHFGFFPVDQIKFFYVSSDNNSCYHSFGVWAFNQEWDFCVNSRYARDLYEKLLALCPKFFCPSPNTTPINLNDYRYSYVTIDSQNVTLYKYKLFNFKNAKQVLAIPVSKIRSCYQTYDSDADGTLYYLFLRMFDGTEHRIGVHTNLIGFRIARRIKAVVPDLVYEFPAGKR